MSALASLPVPTLVEGDAATPRAVASRLLAAMRADRPSLLDLDGVDLGPALEQQLFFALRDGAGRGSMPGRIGDVVRGTGRAIAATAAGLRPRSRIDLGVAPIVVVVRLSARFQIIAPIEAALDRLAGEHLVALRVARASGSVVTHPRAPRLVDVLSPAAGLRSLRQLVRTERHLNAATQGWDAIVGADGAARLRSLARRELPRIALGAAGIDALVSRWKPRLLISFDEVGTWSRILPAVARRHGIPTLDLPHAVATLSDATAGADYDRMAVFGARSAAVLRAAGIPASSIVETGAPFFDELATAAPAPIDPERRVLFAAQYVQGAITELLLEAYLRGAVAAAAALVPSRLVVLPHPVQPDGLIEGIAQRTPVPEGVHLVIARPATLHQELPGAFVLVTGSSNSVFEASLAGVPSIMVTPPGSSLVPFAADGLAVAVDGPATAAAAARSLLDPAFRSAVLARARRGLESYLGPLDGCAAERTARLILDLANRGAVRRPP